MVQIVEKSMKEKIKNKVVVECSDTFKTIKAKIINRNSENIKVQMPTGFILDLKKHPKRHYYSFRIGLIEFLTNGIEIF